MAAKGHDWAVAEFTPERVAPQWIELYRKRHPTTSTIMITILHGALGSAHQFEPLRTTLGLPSQVITFHGHGGTADVDQPWDIELFSRQLELELESGAHQQPAQIFGYSMGGYVAIDCALRRPDLIGRIVTLGTKLQWTQEGRSTKP
ncbi:MAG: hypothetical protein IPF79_06155 [Ignavibacteria bacterium]|nr:hypothetical protein [Ignavibacteria bacterium]